MTKKKEETKNENKIIKVVYFDENSAMDYLNISRGGSTEAIQQMEKIKNSSNNVEAETTVGAKLNFLKFFNLGSSISLNGNLVKENNNVLKSTITSTILSDFISESITDKSIEVFSNCELSYINNSITFFKLCMPIFNLLKDDFKANISQEIDFDKMEPLFNNIQGYYELKAEEKGKVPIILRFNHHGFRNNYKLFDVLKMNLVFYTTYIGEFKEEQFDFTNDINMLNGNIQTIKVEDHIGNGNINSKIKVYDVILAGVTNGN